MLVPSVLRAVVLVLSAITASPQTPPDVRLLSEDWEIVYRAAFELESGDAASLPKLIALLDRAEVVPLTNTADLIYPGAKMFYGHGWIIDYDIDRLDVRAGWALEELTFENFGFSDGKILEAQLLAAVKGGQRDVPLETVADSGSEDRTKLRGAAIARAKKWYLATGTRWSRYTALKAALSSGDAFRHMKALAWLRHGFTTCEGLTLAKYRREILPLVRHLSSVGDAGVREQASLLLADKENYWWRYKSDPTLLKAARSVLK